MLGMCASSIGMRSTSLFVSKVCTSLLSTRPRSMVTSAVAPANGAGTSTSATSPTSYSSRSAMSSMMSSSRTGHGA